MIQQSSENTIADDSAHRAVGEVLAAGDSHVDVVEAGPGQKQVLYGYKEISSHKVGTYIQAVSSFKLS